MYREASSRFMANYTVDMLEAKFELEVEREIRSYH